LRIILKMRLMAMVMAGWASAASPVPFPAGAYAMILAERQAEPVAVKLYDENMRESATVQIARDGIMDAATTKEVQRLFKDWRFMRQRPIARATLVMLADLAERYPARTIE